MGGGVISWNSKQQPAVTLSTTKAKYMANTQATKESHMDDKVHEGIMVHEKKKVMVI
jgi:hypothetical protein